MRVLIAYESSGTVREAFRRYGHETWSCDLQPADDGSFFHYEEDAKEVIRGQLWDLIIAHPPCTHLCVSGNAHYADTKVRDDAVRYVQDLAGLMFWHSKHWAIENPVGVLSSRWRRPDQYIQPYQYGHPESKKTGLWLSTGLPELRSTTVLSKPACGFWENQTPSGQNKLGPSKDRWKLRSKTYWGIADAMAQQWGQL